MSAEKRCILGHFVDARKYVSSMSSKYEGIDR